MRLSKIVGIVSASLVLLMIGCVGCDGEVTPPGHGTNIAPITTMSIRGTVHDYRTGGHAIGGVEVRLYTYKKPALPQLPPVGDIIATTVAEEVQLKKRGEYHFEVQLDTLPQGCNKLVVFVDSGAEGYRVVEVVPGAIQQVDLTKWSPALLIAMTITGVVTYRDSGAPASTPVRLYTYNPNPPSYQNIPCGQEIKWAATDEQGKYQLEVSEYEFREFKKLGYDKLVVVAGPSSDGWEVVDLDRGTIEIDLVTGAPVPSG